MASDAIWRAVVQASTRKPVVASMADVAASGGYYIAMGANRILAEPETLTGSLSWPAVVNVKGALDRLGIKVERVTRGQRALSLSPFAVPEQMMPAPARHFMEDFYWQFVDKVAQGRQKTRAEIPLRRKAVCGRAVMLLPMDWSMNSADSSARSR